MRSAVALVLVAGACGPTPLPDTAPSPARFEEVARAARERFGVCAALRRGARNATADMPQGKLVEAFDWDSDGCPEIVVRGGDRLAIWTFRNGRMQRYAPAEALEFDRVEDGDSDGRPDLVDSHRFTLEPPDCVKTKQERIGGPVLLLHSQRDGTFSESDEVARMHVLKQCPKAPKQLLVGRAGTVDPNRSLLNIACARFWGATVEQIDERVAREWPEWQDDYHVQSARGLPCFWRYDLARQGDIEPPIALY